MFRRKDQTPHVYKPQMLESSAERRTIHFEVSPPIEFIDDEARAELGERVLHLAIPGLGETRLALGGHVQFTHSTADRHASVGHAHLPGVDEELFDGARFAIKDALYQALNGVPIPRGGSGSEM